MYCNIYGWNEFKKKKIVNTDYTCLRHLVSCLVSAPRGTDCVFPSWSWTVGLLTTKTLQ